MVYLPHAIQTLLLLECFAGAGGASFLKQGSTSEVCIKGMWAVDKCRDAAYSYKNNNRDTHVSGSHSGSKGKV